MKINKESGQASRLLLVLAIVIIVAIIITYLIMQMAQKPVSPSKTPNGTPPVLPVYEKQLGDIDFIFESAIDRGNTLLAADVVRKNSWQKDLPIDNLGAKFIQVTVGAKNKGTEDTLQGAWDLQNIVDSENRNFVPMQYSVDAWLPDPNPCGALLHPAFDPTSCTKIYEVSKISTGLKIRVKMGENSTALLDLIVK